VRHKDHQRWVVVVLLLPPSLLLKRGNGRGRVVGDENKRRHDWAKIASWHVHFPDRVSFFFWREKKGADEPNEQ